MNKKSSEGPLNPEHERLDDGSRAVRYLEHGFPSELVRWHYHDEYELHLITEGVGEIFIGDYTGRFKAGDLFLTGPYLPHNWISDQTRCRIMLRDRVILFNRSIIENLAYGIPEFSAVRVMLEAARYGIYFTTREIQSESFMLAIRNSDGAERFGYLCAFLHELSSQNHRLLSSSSVAFNTINKAYDAKIQTVIDYVRNHSNCRISLREISDLVGMSENHFSQFFRRATNRRFTDFVNGVRIGAACDLLAHTELQVGEICYEVGFNNVTNFNRQFLAHKEMTPTAYRQRIFQALGTTTHCC